MAGAGAVGSATSVWRVAGQREVVAERAPLARMVVASSTVEVGEASLGASQLVAVEAAVRVKPTVLGTSAAEAVGGAADATCRAVAGGY